MAEKEECEVQDFIEDDDEHFGHLLDDIHGDSYGRRRG